ncbi:hypothetical protein GCM10022255_091970 [Dactylosporangium darangshiense]|uniref:AMP-binding enzyme C-terminal domain-containing protein n=1 Tax=Dactylosporangium darangshiense TaxID=579108 RepID=A0ABP8DPB3_9ACTN
MRQRAAAGLPPHLVPSLFVAIDRLPLTVTGKVDGEALGRAVRRIDHAGGLGVTQIRQESAVRISGEKCYGHA